MTNLRVLQLYVQLVDSEPPIWRRFLIDDGCSLADLHNALQGVMGWSCLHPFVFQVGGDRYGNTSSSAINVEHDPAIVRLSELELAPGSQFTYTYDPQDGWLHVLTLEAKQPCGISAFLPQCLDGKRACPPENCGGIWGYEDLLDRLDDSNDPEYDALLNWIGADFDAEAFDVEAANKRLRKL